MLNWLSRQMPSLMLGLLCVAGLPQPANALDPAKAITQYVHTVWRTDDGLPQNSVTKILETKDGYLWVGTQAGLARFDGVRFTVFDHTNTAVLSDDYISDLVEDRDGTLWIATVNGGLASFRDGVFSHFGAIGSRSGWSLAADSDGSVWIGGVGGLKHVGNGKVIKVYTTADGLSADKVGQIAVGRDRSVWFGTPAGLDRLANGRIQAYSIKDGLPNDMVTGLYPAADGTLWVKTRNADIVRWINGRFEPLSIPDVVGGTIRDVLLDRDGNLWIASGTEGLVRVKGQQVSRFRIKDGLSSDSVASLYEDRDGDLWVGTTSGGLDRFRDGSFTTYAKEEGLSVDQTYSVIEDHAGDIWVTTSDGLDQLHGNQIRVYKSDDKVLDTWALWEDHASNLLVGTSSGGVLRLIDGHLVSMLSERDGIPPLQVSAILEDAMHQFWVAPRGVGLVRFVNGKASLYSTSDGLRSNGLYSLAEGVDGTIWIGSDNGLNSIRNGHIAGYSTGNLAGAWVISLYFDSSNTLWIGTFGRGLFRLQNGRFTQYTTHQGLPDDTINGVVEDGARNVWIGTDHNIARLTRQDLDAVAAGSSPSVTPLVFGKGDGMKSSEAEGGTHPSAWRAHDGRLWFPTNRGVVVVDPAHLLIDNRPPPARIEEMVADEVLIHSITAVRLPAGTRRLEIRYTAPNLSSPERTRFRYRLDGFDEKWVEGGTQRVAHYTNLSPGHYRFRVSARAETGVWSPEEATLGFDLDPQFYQTWWFRLLCGLAGISLLWGAYRLRVGWLHARAAVMEERQRIAREIHDSLAQGLSGIMFQTEAALLTMPPGVAAKRVTSARDLAKSSLDDARYSVLDLSLPVLDQKNLAESIPSMARQLAHGRVDDLEINFSGNAFATRPEANHHIVMIAQEAISNAIQHGHARTIAIKLAYLPDGLRLSVSDDGSGFTPNAAAQPGARGYGMRNMRHRAKRLGAALEVSSEVGKGTQIALRVPRLGGLKKAWFSLLGKDIARIDG
jgi:signal transduction histidine kinase/ligand-binding sensor domain-containing protein